MNEGTNDFELLGSPWICENPHADWTAPAAHGIFKKFKKKEIIIHSGDQIDCIYYLNKGRIKTVAQSPSGSQKILWYIEAGSIFGETPFFNRKPCDYNFFAVTDCEIYIYPMEIIMQEIIPKFPDLTLSIIKTLSRKVHILSTQVEDCVFNKPLARVAKLIYLLHQGRILVDKRGSSSIPLTQEDIANTLGMHRVTVNQALKHLKEIQALKDHTHLMIINDLEKLKEVMES
ncbi:Crp/Fnr family transcriptional regulator [Desulfitobacterium chlororespirans]|uniref:Transcriptional regulator, Crp/Fnr family n=1 Tax=Desulfitobacterium chlororespirans DSM 11544 TaxID=1121395 RepID=A0A1M7SLQ7_9FIRM|nr:Crp/Fnr family transcriptional regulator [Desulfitobacterium chlororespirans]SHN59423.1 transcriptional regulator, Crp/Fnr family [Desulfitobacterium chlororespirans DSM 11544]